MAGKQADGCQLGAKSPLERSGVQKVHMANGGLTFFYSVFSTYNFDTYQFGYQHELVSFSVY
jgi:hypothetical protein